MNYMKSAVKLEKRNFLKPSEVTAKAQMKTVNNNYI